MSNQGGTINDRAYAEKGIRDYIKELKRDAVLGMTESEVENKDVFLLAAAIGINHPRRLESRDGLFNFDVLKNVRDKVPFEVMKVGTLSNDDDYDRFSSLEKCMLYCEQCAASGFDILREKVISAKNVSIDNFNEVLEERLLKDLDDLYRKNVEDDL